MQRRLSFRIVLIGGLAGLFVLGFIPWDVTGPTGWACRRLGAAPQGWEVTVGQARWIPWRRFEFIDLKLRVPQSGRLHLVKVAVFSEPWALLKGYWMTRWQLGEIRIDPGSWGIHSPRAQEMLSSGPITTDGFAILQWQLKKITLQQLMLHGRFLRLHAEGWLTQGRQAHLVLRGELLRTLLEGMNLMESGQENVEPWEPFDLEMAGPLIHPELQFHSKFFTFAMNPQVEKRS